MLVGNEQVSGTAGHKRSMHITSVSNSALLHPWELRDYVSILGDIHSLWSYRQWVLIWLSVPRSFLLRLRQAGFRTQLLRCPHSAGDRGAGLLSKEPQPPPPDTPPGIRTPQPF